MDTNARDHTAASFRAYLHEGKLMASFCPDCDKHYLPPRAICPHCFSENMEWRSMSGKGKLAAFTAIHIVPTAMEAKGFGRENPYITGIVDLNEGVRITARIEGVDPKSPAKIGIGTSLALKPGTEILTFEPENSVL